MPLYASSTSGEYKVFGAKKAENQHPHVKHTKLGEPYLDVEEFYKSDLAKKLEKRREEIENILVGNASSHKKKSRNQSS